MSLEGIRDWARDFNRLCLLIRPNIRLVICPVIRLVIRPVIGLVIHLVIHLVICLVVCRYVPIRHVIRRWGNATH